MENKKLYTEDSIQSLSPLEFTRLRPGVYVGSTEYSTQLLIEIISNAVDEYKAGHGNKIIITITDDSQFRSSDLFIKLGGKYKLISCGRILPKIKIEPKSERDNINKSFFISIIDTILELNTEYEPLIKKK